MPVFEVVCNGERVGCTSFQHKRGDILKFPDGRGPYKIIDIKADIFDRFEYTVVPVEDETK